MLFIEVDFDCSFSLNNYYHSCLVDREKTCISYRLIIALLNVCVFVHFSYV